MSPSSRIISVDTKKVGVPGLADTDTEPSPFALSGFQPQQDLRGIVLREHGTIERGNLGLDYPDEAAMAEILEVELLD